jgi:DNA helicase IV
MEERIRQRIGVPVQARTFHSLGLEILAQVEGRKPSLAPWAGESSALDPLLQGYVNELLSEPGSRDLLVDYLARYLVPYKPPEQFKSLHEYARFIKAHNRSAAGSRLARPNPRRVGGRHAGGW